MSSIGDNCVIYFCVKNGYMVSDEEVQKSLKYTKAQELLAHFDCEVKYDITSSNKSDRPVLDAIIESKPDDIIMSGINALGSNIEEIVQWYETIYDKGIRMCFAEENKDNDIELVTLPFSTAEVTGVAKYHYFEELISVKSVLLEKLRSINPKSIRSMTMRTNRITVDFKSKNLYWMIEMNTITETDAIAELKISKNTFRKIVGVYEASAEYEKDLQLYVSRGIANNPKQIGAVPAYIADTNEKYEKFSYDDAKAKIFEEYGIDDNYVNSVMYHRYRLKYERKLHNKMYRKK